MFFKMGMKTLRRNCATGGIKVIILLFFLLFGSFAEGESTEIYFDGKIWKKLTNFSKELIGKKYYENICIPDTKNCKHRFISRFPWRKSLPIERIYYAIFGIRDFEQYHDTFVLLVETDSQDTILDTKLKFSYDHMNFFRRGILPNLSCCFFSLFGKTKEFSIVLKEYIKAKDLNYEQAIVLIDGSGLDFRPKLSNEKRRVYREPRLPVSYSFETSSIEVRAMLLFNPDWPDYIRLSRGNDSFPVLEFSNNGSFWVADPNVK